MTFPKSIDQVHGGDIVSAATRPDKMTKDEQQRTRPGVRTAESGRSVRDPSGPPTTRRPFFAAGRICFIAFAVLLALSGLIFTRNLIDFPVYYEAGKSLLSGRTDLYAADFARGAVMDYRYPPLFILMFAPLSLLPYKAAALIWHLLNVTAICWSVALLNRLVVSRSGARTRVWVLAFFTVAPYFVMMLHYGNAHLSATALMFGGLYLAVMRREFGAATLLALAVTIKITPLLVLPYFLIKRRFKLLTLALVITAALNFAPSSYFGVARNAELLREWYAHVVAGQEFHEANGPINLSLKGQLRRYLTKVDYSKRVDGDTRYSAVNVTELPVSVADGLWIGLSAALFVAGLGLIFWSAKHSTRSQEREPSRLQDGVATEGLQLGLMVCLMLLIGPLTSKIYFVALLWPVVWLAGSSCHRRFILRVLFLIAFVSSALPLLPGRGFQRLLLVLGVDFYLNCSLLGLVAIALVLVRRNELRSASPRTPAPPSAKAP
ncbi:MAG TPA: glycosyltransferase family 87 protein [Blastocatellia bacterium]|nr:glycosyltransferase family 87 protein [Blastocatellia bacterium]